MEIFLHPAVMFELLLGGIVGWYPRWPFLRVLTLAFVPIIIGLTCAACYGLFAESGESRGWGFLVLVRLVPAGFASYATGMLIGYLVRRIQNQTHDT